MIKNNLKLILSGVFISLSAGLCCGDLTQEQIQAAQQVVREIRENLFNLNYKGTKLTCMQNFFSKLGIDKQAIKTNLALLKEPFLYDNENTTLFQELNRIEKAQEVKKQSGNAYTHVIELNDKVLLTQLIKQFKLNQKFISDCINYIVGKENLLESFDTLLSAADKKTLKTTLEHTNVFYWAAQEGKTNIIKVILKNSISVDFKDKYNHTPLYYAVMYGHEDTVQLLIDKNANVSFCYEGLNTILHYAAEEGNEDIVNILLDAPKINIDARNKYKCTPPYYSRTKLPFICGKNLIG